MKNIKTRIAAVACAALAAVCGMQALSASAFNYCYPYSVNTQEWCYRNTGRSSRMWQNGMAQNSYWSQTVKAGTMVGKGFTNSHPGVFTTNQNLTNANAFVRYLACSHFGLDASKAAWIELPKTQFTANGHYEFADQIFLARGNERHAVLCMAASVNSSNVTELTCAELVNNRVKWNVKYQMIRYNQNNSSSYFAKMKRVSDGKTYDIMYVARPVKEGDANGDGTVTRNDVQWIQQRISNNNGNPNVSGCNNNLRKAAADVNGSGWLDDGDYTTIYGHMYESWSIMMGDYRYALTAW
ncbi:MAG: dockerin type I repeat-containing protein [Oscillospiraceae bacterium]|nr:dockerin type I repeat-containing protein [Oscillospiraceae bacterium]